ncbi:hypothetical protein GCM10010431_33750 [Streptomyces kunmingensis]
MPVTRSRRPAFGTAKEGTEDVVEEAESAAAGVTVVSSGATASAAIPVSAVRRLRLSLWCAMG